MSALSLASATDEITFDLVGDGDEWRRLTAADGAVIDDTIAAYVALFQAGNSIRLLIDGAQQHHPRIADLRRHYERRPDLYRSVSVQIVPGGQIPQLPDDRALAIRPTVPNERRACTILRAAYAAGSTDIHLIQRDSDARIAFRLHGDLTDSGITLSKDEALQFCTVLANMADDTIAQGNYSPDRSRESAIVQNLGRLGLAHLFSAIRLQFNPPVRGPEVLLRLQPALARARPLDQLGLRPPQIELLKRAGHVPDGCVLICGRTGSGKTVLQAALLDWLTALHPEWRAVSYEQPVEIDLPRVSQHQINEPDPDRRAAILCEILRSLVRQDLQLAMIQELRDAVTAGAFIEAVTTGHWLTATVHAPTPARIIERLRCWHIDPMALADPETIRLLVGVRLVKRLCPNCRRPIRRADDPAVAASIMRVLAYTEASAALRGADPADLSAVFSRHHAGCSAPGCRNGAIGRTQIAEVVPTTRELLDLLAAGRQYEGDLYLRQVAKIPRLVDEAIERVALGELCPLDLEAVLGDLPEPQ
jgi:general secretion pathway protein E